MILCTYSRVRDEPTIHVEEPYEMAVYLSQNGSEVRPPPSLSRYGYFEGSWNGPGHMFLGVGRAAPFASFFFHLISLLRRSHGSRRTDF
jgi:hypothetical protein